MEPTTRPRAQPTTAAPHPIGANTWIWVSPLSDERLATLAPRLRDWGFDLVELPLENVDDVEPGRTADLLARLGLGATTCAVFGEGRDLSTTDRDVLDSTQAYLRGCVDAAGAVGASVVAGPIYSPVGLTWRMSADERRATIARIAERLKAAADYAGAHGVSLGIEPLNRFETSTVNTVEQALELIDLVGSEAVGVALDTFHMNIEERSQPDAIRAAAGRIAHVQVCANTRGTPGDDPMDWPGILAALGDAGYTGPLCIESFTAENQAIATAASIWRPLARTQDDIAVNGLAFLRGLMRA